MRRRILEWIFLLTSRYPQACLGVAALLTILSVAVMPRLQMETNLANLLPEDNPEAQALRRTMRDFGPFDSTIGVLTARQTGQSELLMRVAEELIPLLNNENFFRFIEYKIDADTQEYIKKEAERRIACLLTDSDRLQIEHRIQRPQIARELRRLRSELLSNPPRAVRDRLLEDPLRLSEIILERLTWSRGPLRINLHNGYFLSRDGKMLFFFAQVKDSASNTIFNRELDEWKHSVQRKLFEQHPEWRDEVHFYLLGPHTEAVYQSNLIEKDFIATLITSLILVLTLFLVSFRRLEVVYLVGVPLAAGIMWTLGFSALTINRLTLVSFGFGAVLVGLGIDFAIHIYNRYLEEVRHRRDPDEAVHRALMGTGRGVFTGAITTALAFYGMILTSFKGFVELGIIAGTGLLMCLVSIYLILPPVLILLGRRRKNLMANPYVTSYGLEHTLATINTFPRLILTITLAVTAYLAWKAHNLTFDENLRNVRQRSPEYAALMSEIGERYQLPSNKIVIVVSGTTLQEALARNDRLYRNYERLAGLTPSTDAARQTAGSWPLLKYDSLRTVLPSIETQQESKAWVAGLDVERLKRDVRETAAALKLNTSIFEPFFERLERLQAYARDPRNEIRFQTFYENKTFTRLVQLYVWRSADRARIISYLYPLEGHWENYVPPEFLAQLTEGVPGVEVTGMAIVANAIQRIVKRDLIIVTFIVFLAVSLVLLLHFKRLWAVGLAVLPLAVGMIWMLGLTAIFGVDLNFINVIVIPMIIGIGVDNGVHLLERWLHERRNRLVYAIRYTGRALIITSLTTICGFGSLVLADFRAIREVGLLCLLGVLSTLVAALFVLPAALTLLEPFIAPPPPPASKLTPTPDAAAPATAAASPHPEQPPGLSSVPPPDR
ncbi:MAG: MMPL family transporter [Candidatus Sumerlaeia bacterium]